jgi:peptidoglycan/xylan/chitin deacetylase (PgdA/CDA1 family)
MTMLMRRFLLGLLAFIACWPVMPAIAADSAVVLMYHRFGEDRFPSTSIRVDQFEAQLNYLRDNEYTVVPLADVIAALTDEKALPPRAVAITIDDAYRSVYEVATPLFREYGYPFTVFVATDAVDDGLRAYMTWDQMREMADGGATFANHGASHESLIAKRNNESDADWLSRIRADVDKGWQRLSAELDPLPGVFAYPYGEFDTAAANLLRDAGYIAFGQQSGSVGMYSDTRALPRFPMAESFAGMDQFRTKVASLPMPVQDVMPWEPVVTTTQPRIEVTLIQGHGLTRISELACFVAGQGRVEVEWFEPGRRFAVGPEKPFGPGRRRVNCTAPGNEGRYYWFSHAWIVQTQ